MRFEHQNIMYARIEQDVRRSAYPPKRDSWSRRMAHEEAAKKRAEELRSKSPLAMHILAGDKQC